MLNDKTGAGCVKELQLKPYHFSFFQIAIDSNKKAFTWGYGAYGRLGHADNKDELLPRLIKFFDAQNRGVKQVFCGATYTFMINDLGKILYFSSLKKKKKKSFNNNAITMFFKP